MCRLGIESRTFFERVYLFVTKCLVWFQVQVGDDSYIHLRVYKPLPFMNRKPSLVAVLGGKSKDDKIEYFAAARRIIGWRVRTHGRRRLGGSSEEKPATDEIQKLVDGVSISV